MMSDRGSGSDYKCMYISSCIAHSPTDREYWNRWNLGRVHRVLLASSSLEYHGTERRQRWCGFVGEIEADKIILPSVLLWGAWLSRTLISDD